MHAAMATGEPYHGEVLNYRKDGTTFWNEVTIRAVRATSGDGRLMMFVGTVDDISESVQLRLQQCRTMDELRKAHKLINAVPGMVYTFKMDPYGEKSFPFVSDGCR